MTAPVPANRPDRWCAQYLFAYDIDDAKLERPVRACLEQRRFLVGGELLLVASANPPMIWQPGSCWRSPWVAAGKTGDGIWGRAAVAGTLRKMIAGPPTPDLALNDFHFA